jgi:hypothetical protein
MILGGNLLESGDSNSISIKIDYWLIFMRICFASNCDRVLLAAARFPPSSLRLMNDECLVYEVTSKLRFYKSWCICIVRR